MKKENVDPKELLKLSEKVQSLHKKFVDLEARTDLKMSEVSIMMEETDKLYSELVSSQQMLIAYASGVTLEEFKKQFDPHFGDEGSCAGCGGSLGDCDDDEDDDEKSEFSLDDSDDEDETV